MSLYKGGAIESLKCSKSVTESICVLANFKEVWHSESVITQPVAVFDLLYAFGVFHYIKGGVI